MNKYILLLAALVAVVSAASTPTAPTSMGPTYAWYANYALATMQIGIYVGCAGLGSITTFFANDGGWLYYYCLDVF